MLVRISEGSVRRVGAVIVSLLSSEQSFDLGCERWKMALRW